MMTNRIEFAHILRGFAAATVVFSHFAYLIWRNPEVIGQLIGYPAVSHIVQNSTFVPVTDFGLQYFWGHLGVALFFLISGFVIPFSVSSMSRPGFAMARAFRIWPTYLFGLTIAVICIAINSALAGRAFPYSPRQVLLNALIVTRWPTLTPSIDGIIWTLEIEIFFYVTCLILMSPIRRCDNRIFAFNALVLPAAYLVGRHGGVLLRIGMPAFALANWASTVSIYVCFMFCGVALYNHHQGRIGTAMLLATQMFLLATFVTSLRVSALASLGWSEPISYLVAFGVFALLYFARSQVVALPHWGRRPFQLLADISYPLYAVHAVLGYTILVHALEAGVPALVSVAIASAGVVGLATLVRRTIELPSQKYGKRLAARIGLPRVLSSPGDQTATSRLNVETTSATGPDLTIRPSRR